MRCAFVAQCVSAFTRTDDGAKASDDSTIGTMRRCASQRRWSMTASVSSTPSRLTNSKGNGTIDAMPMRHGYDARTGSKPVIYEGVSAEAKRAKAVRARTSKFVATSRVALSGPWKTPMLSTTLLLSLMRVRTSCGCTQQRITVGQSARVT